MPDRIDMTKDLGPLYRARRDPELVDVPELTYAMIDGTGSPNGSPEYAASVAALFAIAFGAKRALKRGGGPDIKVMPLEGLWAVPAVDGDRQGWAWTAMILLPEAVTAEVFEAARAGAAARAPVDALQAVRRARLAEGRAAQVLHVGPYAAEGRTIARLHAFIRDRRLVPAGAHHEIYLSDPRRTAPERLRTIIRQPVVSG
jgi:hypothetical protein